MRQLLSIVKDVKFIIATVIGIVVALVSAILWVQGIASDVEQAKRSVDKIDKLERIAEQQAVLIETQQDKLDLLVQLYVKLNADDIRKVRELPRSQPLDSMGKPLFGMEWLTAYDYDSLTITSHGDTIKHGIPRMGDIITMTDTGVVVVRNLWNLRRR